MQAPVTKRSAMTAGEVGSNSRIAPFAAAATQLDAKNTRRGSYRSASPTVALIKVPTTKPACTALVKSDALGGGSATSAVSAGTTAEVENQTAKAAT